MVTKIFAHGDTDGICAAALAKARFKDAEVWFTRPVTLAKDLADIKPGATTVILDIGINEPRKQEIFERMRSLAQKGEVIYIDHHPLPPNTLKGDVPVNYFIHSLEGSTSELIYKLFQKDMDPDLDRVALWGSIADYTEKTNFVQESLNKYDHRTIYMESGLLSQALGEAAGDYNFKREVVLKLARGIPPSDMPEIVERAIKATKREWETWQYVKTNVKREDNIALVYDLPSGSLGKAALYALGVTGADVGICTRTTEGEVDMSIRRRSGTRLDLNMILAKITSRVGGTGGGHEGAAGATVPVNVFSTFLELFKWEVSPVISRSLG
ncbi:MAG: hypothetical protein APU95_00095 [Hadesarchaea archaeon YNP_N21]|jgi:RecJ-like exonuclease|nr:MAG: hypothetical protein APU95_00095 [Hadesarchaea archaeon YNP_N21]